MKIHVLVARSVKRGVDWVWCSVVFYYVGNVVLCGLVPVVLLGVLNKYAAKKCAFLLD